MSKTKTPYRFLFAGGGTGGHLFPAIAVAEKIKLIKPEAEILFIGTKSKIEGRVVPKLGYNFRSIWIKGFSRKFTLENILFPLKLLVSMVQSLLINAKFKPGVAIGSGGYVSGPAIWGASLMGAKIILLEQNSYPGVTSRLLEKKADEIHISFEESKKYFRQKEKLKLTGNPVRKSLTRVSKEEASKKNGLDPLKKTLLILGGSLGAETINKAAANSIKQLEKNDIQVIWQTGKNYYEKFKNFKSEMVLVEEFIDDMNSAYSACDLLLARAGATTLAEVLVLGVPSVLVPSPNVAANHQYHNAMSLVKNNAAVLIKDDEINHHFFNTVLELINDRQKLAELKENAVKMSMPSAAEDIAKSALKFIKN